MTPGPHLILKTSPSGALVKIATMGSGNTLGAHYWTDGKREGPMLPDAPWLRCNRSTSELFWTDECEEIAQEEPWGDEQTYRDVSFADEPCVEDYRRALISGVAATPEKEQYIRTRYWWAANDSVRHGQTPAPLSSDYRDNLFQLRALLDTSEPNQRLMAAEVSRQLRDFSTAARLLEFTFPTEYAHAVGLIKKLTSEEDFTVRKVA